MRIKYSKRINKELKDLYPVKFLWEKANNIFAQIKEYIKEHGWYYVNKSRVNYVPYEHYNTEAEVVFEDWHRIIIQSKTNLKKWEITFFIS